MKVVSHRRRGKGALGVVEAANSRHLVEVPARLAPLRKEKKKKQCTQQESAMVESKSAIVTGEEDSNLGWCKRRTMSWSGVSKSESSFCLVPSLCRQVDIEKKATPDAFRQAETSSAKHRARSIINAVRQPAASYRRHASPAWAPAAWPVGRTSGAVLGLAWLGLQQPSQSSRLPLSPTAGIANPNPHVHSGWCGVGLVAPVSPIWAYRSFETN